jgi:hypothetical protein
MRSDGMSGDFVVGTQPEMAGFFILGDKSDKTGTDGGQLRFLYL